jgi:hypothetical protein
MSSASTSVVRRAKAFFEPSGRMRVLILTQLTSYCFLRAAAIWRLLALTSTMKTRVLFSSICRYVSLRMLSIKIVVYRTFFMADSVLSGWIRTLEASMRGSWGTDLRGYLGARDSWRVLGLWAVSKSVFDNTQQDIPVEAGGCPDRSLLVRVRLLSR